MDKICCIVLNYNDAPTTLSLTEELASSRLLTDLVVVDNCSTDDSWERLAVLKNRSAHERSAGSREGGKRAWGPAVHLLRTEKNGGYGAGNQAGIDYAMANLAPDYIAIANPDIHVSDRCIFRVKEALKRQENGAAASAWENGCGRAGPIAQNRSVRPLSLCGETPGIRNWQISA